MSTEMHLGLLFCPASLCLAHLDENCGNVLSSLLHFEKRQIKTFKMGRRGRGMEKYDVDSVVQRFFPGK